MQAEAAKWPSPFWAAFGTAALAVAGVAFYFCCSSAETLAGSAYWASTASSREVASIRSLPQVKAGEMAEVHVVSGQRFSGRLREVGQQITVLETAHGDSGMVTTEIIPTRLIACIRVHKN